MKTLAEIIKNNLDIKKIEINGEIFYPESQIRALLEGLKMEKKDMKVLSNLDNVFENYTREGLNEAVELLNNKISTILGENK